MSCQAQSLSCDSALVRLQCRVDKLLRQCRRFEEMATVVDAFARRWSTTTLARWLHIEGLDVANRELALVALALKATDASGAVIDRYDFTGDEEEHQLFYQIVRIEWEQRRQKEGREQRRAA